MVGDPNWLYSTIAQSSAAIVAIVGGFITATVLMLTSEKRSLTNQQTDKKTRLEALKSEKTKLIESYEIMRIEMFFENVANDLTAYDELPSLEELVRHHPEWNLNPEILKREYTKMSKERLKAREFINLHSDKIDFKEEVTFDGWIRINTLDISMYDYDMLKSEYYRMRDRQQKVLSEEEKTMMGIWRTPAEVLETEPTATLWEQRELGSIKDKLIDVRHEISVLESEISSLDARLKTFSYPPNLGWGIAVLGYLAVFGILLPVLLIYNQVYINIARMLAMAAFYIGIIGIF